jgi:hypothetical protein
MKPIIFLITLFAIVSLGCGSSTPERISTPEQSAWTACTLFVEKQVGISYLDAQKFNPAGVEDLGDGKYQVEVFFAKQDQTYSCELLKQTDGNWKLEGLEVK